MIKRKGLKSAALAIAAFSLIAGACGSDSDTATEETTAEVTEETTAALPGEGILACQVTDTGGVDDKGFNQISYKGMQDAEATLGVTIDLLESTSDADYAPNLQNFADKGCNIIVTVGFLLGDATKAAAEANPDKNYAIVDSAFDPPIANARGLVFATDQPSFMAGYLAAGMTKTGVVGTFGGINIPPVSIFMDGFAKGVAYYNAQKGELVCTKPFPSMPIGFWNDDRYSNYLKSYFSKFEGIWTHGDFASKSINSGFVIHGRSDATLNSKGVRIGTAEIYRVVEQLDEISESLAVAKAIESDSKVILFVVLKSDFLLTDELKQQIISNLRTQASPRHIPDLIIQAPELPRTKSNKLVELAVSDLINGRSVRNRDSLLNPSVLDWFAALDLDSLI